jgi:hypothetical protein
MSYVLNRKPTLTRTSSDGTTYVEKINPMTFSIAPYLGLGVTVASPTASQIPAAAAATPAAPKDEPATLKLNPNLGVKLRFDF